MTRLRAREGLSELFDIHVELACPDAELDLAPMIWSNAVVLLTPMQSQGEGTTRAFHGVIEQAHDLGRGPHETHRYAWRLRPALHGLRYRVRTRIFQDKTAVEIIRAVLTDAGIPSDAIRWDTEPEVPTRTYCTQWRESELDFILRLLEDEGIAYWFEHSEVDHVLCFGDAPTVHTPIEGDPVLPVRGEPSPDWEGLWHPVLRSRRRHDAVKTRDFNFEVADAPVSAQAGDQTTRTRYEYPGGYRDGEGGARLAGIRREALTHDRVVLSAQASSLRLAEGRRFELEEVRPETLAGEYLLTQLEHRFEMSEWGRSDGNYRVELQAIPAETPFRPPRRTPRPRVSGLETAVVTGPPGEEIHVDEHGRIKVHFYWDREQPVDDTASCWIRYQQLNTQGAMILPRVGWEIHVAFEHGDPDRPVGLHKAYNLETMPPYELPFNKTQLSLQSSTSPGGGATNEIRMQDGAGGMEWFLHASKDLNVVVANDENETVGIDCEESVGGTMSSKVGGDETWSVGSNQSISVTTDYASETVSHKTVDVGVNDDWGLKGNFSFTTGVDRTETISGLMNVLANDISITVNGGLTRNVGAVQAYVAAGSIAETIGADKTETVTAAKAIITPGEYSEDVGGAKTLTSGAATINAGAEVSYSAEGAIAVTSAGKIQITCKEDAMFSGSQIRVTSTGATLKGGGGTFEMGRRVTIDAKKFGGKGGPMLKLKGDLDFK